MTIRDSFRWRSGLVAISKKAPGLTLGVLRFHATVLDSTGLSKLTLEVETAPTAEMLQYTQQASSWRCDFVVNLRCTCVESAYISARSQNVFALMFSELYTLEPVKFSDIANRTRV